MQVAVVFRGALLALLSVATYAQAASGEDDATGDAPSATQTEIVAATLETLDSFVDLRNAILKDIHAVNQQIGASKSDAEKQDLKTQLDELQSDLRAITENFENIVAGFDINILRVTTDEEFNIQRELFALLKPALEEMKEMTSTVRQKADLKEEIAYNTERLPVIEQAIANASRLMTQSTNKSIAQALQTTLDKWQRKLTFCRASWKTRRFS